MRCARLNVLLIAEPFIVKIFLTKPSLLKAALLTAALVLHAPGHAQLYKWVDANGKMHYSDRKDAAGKAQVGAVKHDAAPTAPPPAAGPSWQEREREYKLRQARSGSGDAPAPPSRPPRLSQSYGSNQIDTDKAKCELARDVVSGAVRHVNGAVTDANDRQIAQRDISQFCR